MSGRNDTLFALKQTCGIPPKYIELPSTEGREVWRYSSVERLLYTATGDRILGRKVANHTWLRRGHEGIQLFLHKTPVITWHPDDTITLDTGGWYTQTTKDRINRWLPGGYNDRGRMRVESFRVAPGVRHWFVRTAFARETNWPRTAEERKGWVPFYDGMCLDLVTSTLVSGDMDIENMIEHNVAMDKMIDRWIQRFGRDMFGESKASPDPDNLRPYILEMLEGNSINANTLLTICTQLNLRNAHHHAREWYFVIIGDREASPRFMNYVKAQMRKWLRIQLYIGATPHARLNRATEDES